QNCTDLHQDGAAGGIGERFAQSVPATELAYRIIISQFAVPWHGLLRVRGASTDRSIQLHRVALYSTRMLAVQRKNAGACPSQPALPDIVDLAFLSVQRQTVSGECPVLQRRSRSFWPCASMFFLTVPASAARNQGSATSTRTSCSSTAIS